jgi:hypothetical protein
MLAILLATFIMENVNTKQKETKRSKINEWETEIKNGVKCGMFNLECGKLFTIYIHDRSSKNLNGFGIMCLRT